MILQKSSKVSQKCSMVSLKLFVLKWKKNFVFLTKCPLVTYLKKMFLTTVIVPSPKNKFTPNIGICIYTLDYVRL